MSPAHGLPEQREYFDAASFRDPAGSVFHHNNRIYRFVSANVAPFAEEFLKSEFYRRNAKTRIVDTTIVNGPIPGSKLYIDREKFPLILEHERIPIISYPYEWPFSLLKTAALFHLDIHLEALEQGYDLVDSSPYNIQFLGTSPIFMDFLSFRAREKNSYWLGYKQFCEQFLGPLLICSRLGVPYNAWYRGAVNGLEITDVARLLPISSYFSLRTIIHVLWHAKLIAQAKSSQRSVSARASRERGISTKSVSAMLTDMRHWIETLHPGRAVDSYWKSYESTSSYDAQQANEKRRIVQDFIRSRKPAVIVDFGCNAGQFSQACLESGADCVVGLDSDLGALEAATARAENARLNLLPLYVDLTNMSPSQGWAGEERPALTERLNADCVVALAIVHHLAIGKNIDLARIFDLLTQLAPLGVIEFVPKADPMVKSMMLHREAMFESYTEEKFTSELQRVAKIVSATTISGSSRTIFCYEKL